VRRRRAKRDSVDVDVVSRAEAIRERSIVLNPPVARGQVPVSRSFAAWLLAAALLLAGCSDSSGQGEGEKQLTIPAYGSYPAVTIPVTEGTPALCRRDAQAFTRAAVSFRAPFPSDADNYFVLARVQFFDFKGHLCDVRILRRALSRQLTVKQRRELVARLGFLSDIERELTEVQRN
jgi:hypothetical protein